MHPPALYVIPCVWALSSRWLPPCPRPNSCRLFSCSWTRTATRALQEMVNGGCPHRVGRISSFLYFAPSESAVASTFRTDRNLPLLTIPALLSLPWPSRHWVLCVIGACGSCGSCWWSASSWRWGSRLLFTHCSGNGFQLSDTCATPSS